VTLSFRRICLWRRRRRYDREQAWSYTSNQNEAQHITTPPRSRDAEQLQLLGIIIGRHGLARADAQDGSGH
jgi:hypothetical protein